MNSGQKIDLKIIGYINTFEKITKIHPIEFKENNGQLVFIVKEDQVKKAVGKGGINIKKLSNLFNKRIKVVEYSKNPEKFFLNLIHPIIVKTMELTETQLLIRPDSIEDKSKIIGKNGKNLEFINSLMYQHHKTKIRMA